MTARRRRILPVVFAPTAIRDLEVIWHWNEKTYGRAHAARYIESLQRQIDALGSDHRRGRAIVSRSDLRYIELRHRSRSHRHIAVFSVSASAVNIVRVFHTAQDWQSILAQENPSE